MKDGRPSEMEGKHTESRGTPDENGSLNIGAPSPKRWLIRRVVVKLGVMLQICLDRICYTFGKSMSHFGGFPGARVVKNLPAMQEMRVQSLGQEDPLEN